MIERLSKKYYVYTLAYPNGTVFYAGKGSGRRILEHEEHAQHNHRSPRCAVIRQIWREGGMVVKSILFETDDNTQAYWHEEKAIRQYRGDELTNDRKAIDIGTTTALADGTWLARIRVWTSKGYWSTKERVFSAKKSSDEWLAGMYDRSYFRFESYITSVRSGSLSTRHCTF